MGDFWDNLGSNLGTQFGEAVGASLFGGSSNNVGSSDPNARFYPWNVNNAGVGVSYNPTTRGVSTTYSPEHMAANTSLWNITNSNLNAAQMSDPYAIGQSYYDRIKQTQQAAADRQLAGLRDNLFATGRLGLGMGPNNANPELAAYYQSLFEQDNMLAANSLKMGQDIVDQTLARGRSAMEGTRDLWGRGMETIKLGGVLGTYGQPVGFTGGAPSSGWGSVIGGIAGGPGTVPPGTPGPVGGLGAITGIPGFMPGGTTNLSGSLDQLTGGVNSQEDYDLLEAMGLGGGGFWGNFGDALLPDEAVNSMVNLFGGAGEGLAFHGSGAPVGPPSTVPFADPSATGAAGMYDESGNLVQSGGFTPPDMTDIQNQQQASAAQAQLNSFLATLSPAVAQPIVEAIRSGNTAEASRLIMNAMQGQGSAGFGWTTMSPNGYQGEQQPDAMRFLRNPSW